MKLRKSFISFSLISSLLLLSLNSCDVVQQAAKMATLAKCEFRLQSVSQLTLAGINVQSIHKLSDLSLLDAGKLSVALASGQFPLDFTLNVEAKNPNSATAGLTKMDWILYIDGIEMTKGIVDQQVTIPANNGITVIPMKMTVDLKQALSGKSADAILNFGMNLAGIGNKPTRFTMKLQPTINVASFPITYPGYITVGTEFSGL
ncbi:MAG: hypothetical protein IPH88_01540 [Bacteroidales bacterium]|nr:hypothetical protein [Bacteroidales bacterium]